MSDRERSSAEAPLFELLDRTFGAVDDVLESHRTELEVKEIGTVQSVAHGIARVSGLPGALSEELVHLGGGVPGLVFNLDPDQIGIVLLDESERVRAGAEVTRTGRMVDVPVGEAMLGRVVDPIGRPLDNREPPRAAERRPAEREAPAIMDRDPVTVPLQTGVKVVDALIPIGRGQRELVLGDRQTGKTAIAVDTMINQHDKDVVCIYCAVGKRGSAVAKVVDDLRRHDALRYSIVVVAEGDDPPGLQFLAPYAATTIGEYFMELGRDVLVVYDDLTRHARAYRELSLLLRRPPGREAYPGDIFYIHSRLLERSTHLRENLGGGSLTALPIVETQAQNISAYIPTNLISITDGQVYLSPDLFRKGIMPAVDVGKSVSRVGGKTQLRAYREVAGDLRLAYSQFVELETFARFGTRLDEETRRTLERGRRVREILKQPEAAPLTVPEQIAALVAVNEGALDELDLDRVGAAEKAIRRAVRDEMPEIGERILAGEELTEEDLRALKETAARAANAEAAGAAEGSGGGTRAGGEPAEKGKGSSGQSAEGAG
jgi:F-type H+-transporting ATPase subunit alpha